MVTDIIDQSRLSPGKLTISPSVLTAMVELRAFLFANVYESEAVYQDFRKASRLLEEIYDYFRNNKPENLVEHYPGYLEGFDFLENLRDFIAGMTDRYAFSLYEKLFLPHPWNIK